MNNQFLIWNSIHVNIKHMYLRSRAKTLQNRKTSFTLPQYSKIIYIYFKKLQINLLKTTVMGKKIFALSTIQKNKAIHHPKYFKPVHYYNTYILRSCKEMRNVIICL